MNDVGVVILGATGAVGRHAARTCAEMPEVTKLTLLGRRPLEGLSADQATQVRIDIFDPASYDGVLAHHEIAICTLGVGQPSKVSREEYVRIDKRAVLDFAEACRNAGVRHFQLLGSIGANPRSRSFYLRVKGELEERLASLGFERLSLFRPSMILTPTNRYGLSQAITLALWPRLTPILRGPLRRLRGIEVERLGRAIALNSTTPGRGVHVLRWGEIDALARGSS